MFVFGFVTLTPLMADSNTQQFKKACQNLIVQSLKCQQPQLTPFL